ncbi:hypothetical protein [Bradyrhizobium sp. AZCC 1708]|uniref:hypothetical protein n=1 Tax=Bradyrhizobium sp. AZCC 1708 TaxID=3117015 RepID=UPI002FF07344
MIDAFVLALDLANMGFEWGGAGGHGSKDLHYLNRVQSSRRLKREVGRTPGPCGCWADSLPIAIRLQTSARTKWLALRRVCARFVELCRQMGLLATASVAIDDSKFKAVNTRDKKFKRAQVERRRAQLEETSRAI